MHPPKKLVAVPGRGQPPLRLLCVLCFYRASLRSAPALSQPPPRGATRIPQIYPTEEMYREFITNLPEKAALGAQRRPERSPTALPQPSRLSCAAPARQNRAETTSTPPRSLATATGCCCLIAVIATFFFAFSKISRRHYNAVYREVWGNASAPPDYPF